MSDPKSMGEAFMQRRAAVAAASKSSTKNHFTSSTTSSRSTAMTAATITPNEVDDTNTTAMSMVDIQLEQLQQRERQQQQQQQQHPVDEYGRLVRMTSGGRKNRDLYNLSVSTSQIADKDNHYLDCNSSCNQHFVGGSNSARYVSARSDGGRASSKTNRKNNNMPLEQGVIHSLLDKFGFILCADRDREIFFHYSEYNKSKGRSGTSGVIGNSTSDELNIGDEVEFHVGISMRGGGGLGSTSLDERTEKLSAFDVRKIPPGTIYWETEDEPRGERRVGIVKRVADMAGSAGNRRRRSEDDGRSPGGGPMAVAAGVGEGLIRICNEKCDDTESDIELPPDVNFKHVDIHQTSNQQRRQRRAQLEFGDMVEFKLVTERRTKKKYAREITLIRSERERQREEEEKRLMENATLERGVVVSVKGDFGFLRSTCRVEEVFFHFSHVVLCIEGDSNCKSEDVVSLSALSLKEGQEVEFYVVDETRISDSDNPSDGDDKGRAPEGSKKRGSGKRLSARKITMLPKGTVKFEHTIARGVSGWVTECLLSAMGKIRLVEDIIDSDGQHISEVFMSPEVYPGGTLVINRTGSELGSWIRPGDLLMFDVVKKVVDGTCHAAPTEFAFYESLRLQSNSVDNYSISIDPPSIRLIEPSLCGRTEGVIRSIHDNYGFIQLAERNVDAYFPLFELFPAEILGDIVRNNPGTYRENDNLIREIGGRIHVEVGMEVAFDVSLQTLSNVAVGRDGGSRFKQSRPVQDKQSLRARRVQILPYGTVKENIALASGVLATVARKDTKQLFFGALELTEALKAECITQHRHPLVAKLIESFSSGKFGVEKVIFHDVLSDIDSNIVTSMVNARDDLEWSYCVPMNSSAELHNRRICITRKQAVSNENSVEPCTPMLHDDANIATADEIINAADEEIVGRDVNTSKKGKQHNSQTKSKTVKSVRFDQSSFLDMSDCSFGVGDVVTCDVYLSRRSGALKIENISIVERKIPNVITAEEVNQVVKRTSLTGFVSEVIPSRQFGFITAVDENGIKTGEHIFFHYREVGSPIPQDHSPTKNNKFDRDRVDVISKGDEVTFDSGPGKNGKLNATNISILTRGTLKQSNILSPSLYCTGYILIEPSRTLLMNTPYQATQSAQATGVGRWANVRDELVPTTSRDVSCVNGEGVILLLTDPKDHSISSSIVANSDEDVATSDLKLETDNISSEVRNLSVERRSRNDKNALSAVGTHLRYKFSSLTMRGHSSDLDSNRPDGPKRGDLVTFNKVKGSRLVKDVRIEKQGAASRVTGTLKHVDKVTDTAIFVLAGGATEYSVKLTEVVSCDKALIHENEQVDGIIHEGKMFGVCRTKDIHLTSTFGTSTGLGERPKLNLTVKKELQGMGGQIMAQSRMAKGPDGTNGFVLGWTKRLSAHVLQESNSSLSTSLSASALEFVPNCSIDASGFGQGPKQTECIDF